MTKENSANHDLTDDALDDAQGGLFAGASGTGKTMNAALLGKERARAANSAMTEEIEMVVERLERG